MPYFLVTYTALIEADDEITAAEKTLAKIQEGGETRFTVKSDEATTRQVVLNANKNGVSLPPMPDTSLLVQEAVSLPSIAATEGNQNGIQRHQESTRLFSVGAAFVAVSLVVCIGIYSLIHR